MWRGASCVCGGFRSRATDDWWWLPLVYWCRSCSWRFRDWLANDWLSRSQIMRTFLWMRCCGGWWNVFWWRRGRIFFFLQRLSLAPLAAGSSHNDDDNNNDDDNIIFSMRHSLCFMAFVECRARSFVHRRWGKVYPHHDLSCRASEWVSQKVKNSRQFLNSSTANHDFAPIHGNSFFNFDFLWFKCSLLLLENLLSHLSRYF